MLNKKNIYNNINERSADKKTRGKELNEMFGYVSEDKED